MSQDKGRTVVFIITFLAVAVVWFCLPDLIPRWAWLFDRITGSALVGLGIGLAADRLGTVQTDKETNQGG